MPLMQVSRKIDYVLRAVIHLAREEDPAREEDAPSKEGLPRKRGGRACTIAEIAESQKIPRKFLEKILQDLMHKGIVVSRRGPHGGYVLARPRQTITFREVIEAVEGPVAVNVCVGEHHDCSLYAHCGMLWVWQEAQRRVIDLFSKTTLADIPSLQRSPTLQNSPSPQTSTPGARGANNRTALSV
jgi:Rrf2 family protein